MKKAENIKYKGSPKHDQTMIKTCAVCNIKYHPRNNGYQMTSRFCSQKCSKRGRRLIGL